VTTHDPDHLPPGGRSVRLAGIAAEHYAGDDRPPLVLVHGLTFDRHTWTPVVQELRAIDPRRDVLVIDLPGHGASPGLASHDSTFVVDAIHDAVAEAGPRAPVMVGHSVSAVLVTLYATRYPTSGVVNVDQTLQVEGFARFINPMAERLRSDEFATLWTMFDASFHTELLPADAQRVVRATSNPRQEVVLSYWRELLDLDPSELPAWIERNHRELRKIRVPYLYIAGSEPPQADLDLLLEVLPQSTVKVWPQTGHFPHLAHPHLFARHLAATEGWPDVPMSSLPDPN
jgi:pimeloyl-ACP methyl ester carboxylesterase